MRDILNRLLSRLPHQWARDASTGQHALLEAVSFELQRIYDRIGGRPDQIVFERVDLMNPSPDDVLVLTMKVPTSFGITNWIDQAQRMSDDLKDALGVREIIVLPDIVHIENLGNLDANTAKELGKLRNVIAALKGA